MNVLDLDELVVLTGVYYVEVTMVRQPSMTVHQVVELVVPTVFYSVEIIVFYDKLMTVAVAADVCGLDGFVDSITCCWSFLIRRSYRYRRSATEEKGISTLKDMYVRNRRSSIDHMWSRGRSANERKGLYIGEGRGML